MQYLREGGCLVIYKLDRLGRSLKVCWISSSSFRREILAWYHSGVISTLAGREYVKLAESSIYETATAKIEYY